MLIIRESQLTGEMHAMEIDVDINQIKHWLQGASIQRAMPALSPAEREFILTGITPQEWSAAFGLQDEQSDS